MISTHIAPARAAPWTRRLTLPALLLTAAALLGGCVYDPYSGAYAPAVAAAPAYGYYPGYYYPGYAYAGPSVVIGGGGFGYGYHGWHR